MSMESLRRALMNPSPRGTAGQRPATAGRTAALVLLPYYLASAGWALGRRRPRYLLNSAVCPLVLADALTARRTREQLTRLCSTGSTMDDYWGGPWRHEWEAQ